ncbi:MAG: hypothetical protein CR977_00575 [Gammaproteobacteria bacterium]|nr:MAG: hypothetical protein CR977_00575 [Gammaproteobacteria bacterium]
MIHLTSTIAQRFRCLTQHTAIAFRMLLLAAGAGVSALAQAEVKVLNNQLTARFDDVTLEAALSEIADATGIEITTSQALEQKLSVSYQNMSAKKLLKRLLNGYNAIYLQNPQNGKLEKVRIFSTGNAPAIAQQPPAETPKEAQQENGKYYMLVVINGRPLKMLVDTGANTLALSAQMAARLGLAGDGSTAVQTAGGSTHAYRTRVDSVVMAGKELKNVQAIILPNLKENGLIGQNVLAHYRRLTENNTMRFEPIGAPPATPATPPSKDNNNDPALNVPPPPVPGPATDGQPEPQPQKAPVKSN